MFSGVRGCEGAGVREMFSGERGCGGTGVREMFSGERGGLRRSRFSRIICCGTSLMAAAPMGSPKPGRVTRPTPSPPRIAIPPSPPGSTVTQISRPSVMSGSSPACLTTVARPFSTWLTSTSMSSPLGRRTLTVFSPVTAAMAAAVAHVPVVSPVFRGKKSGTKCSTIRRKPCGPLTIFRCWKLEVGGLM